MKKIFFIAAITSILFSCTTDEINSEVEKQEKNSTIMLQKDGGTNGQGIIIPIKP